MTVPALADPAQPFPDDVDLFDVEWIDARLGLAGLLRVVVNPHDGRTWCLVAVLGGDMPVVVLDYDLPLVTHAFEFRSSGIWLELMAEEAVEQWTVGMEAFGLGVEAGEVVTPETVGARTPLGLDLDVEAAGGPESGDGGFRLAITVRGELLVGSDAFELDAVGVRRRLQGTTRPALETVRGNAPECGALSVHWPDRQRPERRVWLGGSRPGWVGDAGRQASL